MYQETAKLYFSACVERMRTLGMSVVAASLLLCAVSPANAAAGQFVLHNTPPYVSTAKNLGADNPANSIEISIWLKLHDRDEMDAVVRDLYNPKSPNFRNWMSRSQITARFAPTAEEAKTVQEFFEAHNLHVVLVDRDNFFVRARGTVADVERAFHVQLNDYEEQNKTIRANASDPYIEGAAAPLVRAVAGLDSGTYEHPLMTRPTAPASLKSGLGRTPDLAKAAPAGSADPSFYSSNCFDGVATQKYSTNNDGELPIGTYTGNHLNHQSLTTIGCGYTPAPIQTAYHLTGLYAEGYTGKGQTIVILDWCGSSTIQSDVNAFSKKFGLPLLDSSNFQIIYTPTPSPCISTDQVEINLDVEWAHAIAPGAKIDLVVPPSNSFQDIDQAEFYAVNYQLGNSLSGSYGSPESETSTSYLETENLISELAAMSGISTNFASGDYGDYYGYLYNPITGAPYPPTVNAPADSPWATGVGGVTLALNSDNSIAWQAGWGNNATVLIEYGQIFDPPVDGVAGFLGGAGGGPSNCFDNDYDQTTGAITCLAGYPKPSFQDKVPGKYRQVPDISWLADPFTGVVVAISVPDESPQLVWEVVGGTSVACPMFSALWAIANEEAGEPLGQAAQYLYSLPTEAITDVVPVTSAHNVTASIKEPTVTNKYTPSEVLSGTPTETPEKFVSALWDDPSGYDTAYVLSFGTDCSVAPLAYDNGTPCTRSSALHTNVGWDNVTGLGTPNGRAFADFFRSKTADK